MCLVFVRSTRGAISKVCQGLALLALASSPALAQAGAAQDGTTLPPITVTTGQPTPSAKVAKKPKKTSTPAPSDTAGEVPGEPAATEETDLVTHPIDATSYFEAISKSGLSADRAAYPASVTVERYSEDTTRATRSYVELLKPITGVAANDFDQGGVGFGLTLRGFTERSNGGNVALFIDGVPVNQAGHRSANGNGDLSSLIPELVDTFELVRGPFDVRAGPFALAGSAYYTTADSPTSGVLAKGGSFEYARGMAVYNYGAGNVRGYGSLVASTTEGYRDNSDWEQYSTFNKALFPLFDGTGSIRFQLYDSDFESPGFVNRAFIRNGTISEKDARNPSDGGNTELQDVVFNYKQKGDEPFTANVYIIHSDHNRYSSRGNTTPVPPTTAGIQFLTQDDRVTYGASLEKYARWDLPLGMGADLLVGAGVRRDVVESNEYRTIARKVVGHSAAIGTLVDFDVSNPFGYVQANLKPFSFLKLTGGVRYDRMSYDIEDQTNPASILHVKPRIDVTQPKAGVTLTPITGLDFFANYGEGFRPPTPIGNAQFLIDPNLPEAVIETEEYGVQYNSPDGMLHILASRYHTEFTDEIFGRPPLQPILLGPSVRDGYDIEARVRAYQSGRTMLSLYTSYSHVDGRLTDPPPGQGPILPDVADYFFKYGFDLTIPLGGDYSAHLLTLSAGQVWEGPKDLDTFGRFSTSTFSRIDASLTYTNENWKGFSVFADAVIYPDDRLDETAFVFSNTVGVSAKAPVSVIGGIFVPF